MVSAQSWRVVLDPVDGGHDLLDCRIHVQGRHIYHFDFGVLEGRREISVRRIVILGHAASPARRLAFMVAWMTVKLA